LLASRGVLILSLRISSGGKPNLNILTKYRIARSLTKGLRLITIQTAIEEGFQKTLAKPLTIDELCTQTNYDTEMKEKVALFLDALVSYGVVKLQSNSDGTKRYRWSRRSDHAKETREIKEKIGEILSHKYCGEILRGQHFELAKNWQHVVRGESENELTRAREMIAISVGLRAKLMEEGRKRAIGFARIRPGMHVLDLGCGAGTSTIQIAQFVGPQGHVVGVEVNENLYSEAVVRYHELPVPYRKAMAEVDFVMTDARERSLSRIGEDFDFATTFLFWHYIKESEYTKVIANISENLKHDGCIAGIEPMHIHDGDIVNGEWTGTAIHEFTNYPFLSRFRNAFKECGFGKFRLSKMLMAFCASRE
jgi:ubiquinone/menaquinone biosynthesis C-methylase UbiE